MRRRRLTNCAPASRAERELDRGTAQDAFGKIVGTGRDEEASAMPQQRRLAVARLQAGVAALVESLPQFRKIVLRAAHFPHKLVQRRLQSFQIVARRFGTSPRPAVLRFPERRLLTCVSFHRSVA